MLTGADLETTVDKNSKRHIITEEQFGMAKIKSTAQIAEKWARVTPQRAEEYRTGVQSPRVKWSEATIAAEDRYKVGVTQAAQEGRFAKGVAKAGDKKWQERAMTVGPGRFAEGTSIAAPQFEAGFAPYARVIEQTTLPPRFAKGDPRNLERVKVMSQALRAAKVGS